MFSPSVIPLKHGLQTQPILDNLEQPIYQNLSKKMAQTFNSKIEHIAVAYKRLLNINVTDSSLQRDIEENPFYPTLLSISDTFDRYNINNAAYNVPIEQFDELEAPFIAMMDIPVVGNDFVLVTEITDKTVSYLYHKNKPEKIERIKFFERFQHTAFVAEPDENSGENDYADRIKKEQHPMAW